MKKFTIYQCIPSYKPAATARIIQSILPFDCKILLDIEDSIQDIQFPAFTSQLKARAREYLIEIIQAIPGQKFCVRINSLSGSEYGFDKELIHTISNRIESVFLPKIETVSELDRFYNDFGDRFKLNLIIETQRGISNLDQILQSTHKSRIEHIFFGNYDFHLDTKTYPIKEQRSPQYWDVVRPIIAKAEANGINFGNSPYVNIEDSYSLAFSLEQLMQLCSRPFAVMSLHKTQTQLLFWAQTKIDCQISTAGTGIHQPHTWYISQTKTQRQEFCGE